MNKRIKQLCVEAGAAQLPGSTGIFINALDPQKFAELIIKECIKAASNPGDELILADTWHDGVRASVWSIQEEFNLDRSFGIEPL
jgi:hypothetical protein